MKNGAVRTSTLKICLSLCNFHLLVISERILNLESLKRISYFNKCGFSWKCFFLIDLAYWLMYNLWKTPIKIFDFKKSLYFFYDAIAEFDKRKRVWIGNLKMQRMQTFVLFFLSIKIIFCRIWGWISQLSYGTYLFFTAGCDRNPC